METITSNDQRFISVAAGELLIPVAYTATELVDHIKENLNRDQHELILKEQGLELPPGLTDEDVLFPAMSFVQNEWFRATRADGVVPAIVVSNHQERLTKLKLRIKEVLAAPPLPPKERSPREPKPPKERPPKALKVEVSYAVNHELAQKVTLGTQANLIREVLLTAGSMTTVGELTKLVEAGGKLVTRQPVHRVVAYYWTQFKDLGLVREVKNDGGN